MKAGDPRLRTLAGSFAVMADMVANPDLYCAEELLGRSLAISRLCFDIAGTGEDETQRRALHDAIAAYVDVPALELDDPACDDCELPMSVCACDDMAAQDEAA